MDWGMTLRNEREKGREEGRMEERAKTEERGSALTLQKSEFEG